MSGMEKETGRWILMAERRPASYGKHLVIRRSRGGRTLEGEYLWNGSGWVTPGNSLSDAVVAWYDPEDAGEQKLGPGAVAAWLRSAGVAFGAIADTLRIMGYAEGQPEDPEEEPEPGAGTGGTGEKTEGAGTGAAGETETEERMGTMSEMEKAAGAAPVPAADGARLAMYEARIALYREQAVGGYIGIGKTLNEAKAAGVVPHGEWEDWVERTTGLRIRQAQRCMQAAAEIREGSFLGQLDVSKAMMLLSSGLEAEQKEALAERTAKEGGTVKQLREEIARLREEKEAQRADADAVVKQLRLKVVEQTGAAAEIREALRKAEAERDQISAQMKARESGWQARMEQEAGNAYRRGADEGRTAAQKEAAAEIRAEFQGRLDFANAKAKDREERLKEAQESLRQAQAELGGKWDEGFRARAGEIAEKEAQIRELEEAVRQARADAAAMAAKEQEIRDLQAELEAAEAREAKRAAELSQLRKDRAQAGMDAARGIRADGLGGLDLTAAVRNFIGAAGTLPQMGSALAGLSEKEREAIRAHVETVAKWVADARAALGVVAADGSVE